MRTPADSPALVTIALVVLTWAIVLGVLFAAVALVRWIA